MRAQSVITSDAGDVVLNEVRFLWIWWFHRVNKRPVSPTCWDFRIERGFRLGGFVFAFRRTDRVYRDHPTDLMRTAL